MTARVGEKAAGQFLDIVGVGGSITQKCHLAFEAGAHNLEASKLHRELVSPRLEPRAGLEAVSAMQGVEPEVGRQAAADQQNRRTPPHQHVTNPGYATQNQCRLTLNRRQEGHYQRLVKPT